MNNDKYLELIAKYLSNDILEPEKQELMEWADKDSANQKTLEELKSVWKLTGNHKEEAFEPDVDLAWEKFKPKLQQTSSIQEHTHTTTTTISPKKAPTPVRSLNFGRLMGIAASFSLIAGLMYFIFNSQSPDMAMAIYESKAEAKEEALELPDDSEAWLNKNSKLTHTTNFTERRTQLEGEAFFQVEKKADERKFVIEGDGAEITVLGTAFNVRSYPEENLVEVSVESGLVELAEKTNHANKVLLKAGEKGTYNKKTHQVKKIQTSTQNALSWKNKKLNFDNANLPAVIEDLKRHFDLDIKTANQNLMKCNFTGNFENPEINEVLEVLTFVLDLEIEKDNQQIILNGQGCDS